MEYKQITRPSHPHVKELIRMRDKHSKKRGAVFFIEGMHLLESALSTGMNIREVLFTEAFITRPGVRQMLHGLSSKSVEMFEISEQVLRKLSDTEAPQGIISLLSYGSSLLEGLSPGDNPLITIIDGVQDPGNVGSIIRTSDAAGAGAVILLPGGSNPFTSKVIRSTSGSIFHLPIIQTDSADLLNWLRDNDIKMAVTLAGSGELVFRTDLRGPLAIVFGNEARGVSKDIEDAADLLVNIPIYGKAESLNVAAAAAICLYEAARQRRY